MDIYQLTQKVGDSLDFLKDRGPIDVENIIFTLDAVVNKFVNQVFIVNYTFQFITWWRTKYATQKLLAG